MKFGYAIVFALIALVFVSGFAAADRLPKQVPENQIFTIDTLIDATGAVSDSSSMQWVIDYQNLTTKTAIPNAAGNVYIAGLTASQVEALNGIPGVTVTVDAAGDIVQLQAQTISMGRALPASVITALGGTVRTVGQLYNAVLEQQTVAGTDDFTETTATSAGSIHDSRLNPTETIALLTWTDELRSNGGKTSLNKNIDFNSKNKVDGINNLEVEKVLTYASTEGAHLNGGESWTLDVAGNYDLTADTIRCVFASSASTYYPAFCNVVKAKSELVNVNSAQISTKGSARAVAATGDVPAALSYQIAVTPDSNSGSGFADGTIKTMFGGSIMEARGANQIPSATNTWKDSASVTGGIKNFQKTFEYTSGFSYN